MKKLNYVCIILCIITLISITSCRGGELWGKENVVWYSDTPKIELDGNTHKGTITVGNKEIPFALGWGPGAGGGHFFLAPNTDYNDEIYNEYDYLSGRWEPRGEDIVLIIEVDKLFDNKYPEILLKQMPIDDGED